MARTRYAPDRGLTVRMTATMFLLGLVFVAFVALIIGIMTAAHASGAAIVLIALLCDQFVRLEPGEHAGDIRLGGNHHASDGRTDEPFGLGAAQDAEDVILGGAQAVGFEPLLKGPVQTVRGAKDGQQRLFLGTGEAGSLLGSLRVG